MHEHHIPRVLTSEEQHRRMLQTPVAKLILSLAAPTVASPADFHHLQHCRHLLCLADFHERFCRRRRGVFAAIHHTGIRLRRGNGRRQPHQPAAGRKEGPRRQYVCDQRLSCRVRGRTADARVRAFVSGAFDSRAGRDGNDAAACVRLWADYPDGRADHVRLVHSKLYSKSRGRGGCVHDRSVLRRHSQHRARPAADFHLRHGARQALPWQP